MEPLRQCRDGHGRSRGTSCASSGKAADLREMADVAHAGEAQYEVCDGQLLTDLAGTMFAVTVYKLGDKYVAARGNEFGYANYAVEAVK